MTIAAPRVECEACGRPPVVCFCALAPQLVTRTRVLLLQHPCERKKGIGTARMAHAALPGSVLRVGTDFSADPVVCETLAGATPTYVLFPSPDAIEPHALAGAPAFNLIVLDGTWSQARKLLRINPALAALPRVAFTPKRPSGYLIRRQPAPGCVSTIEALAEVLGALEPDAGSFEGLLAPFHAFVGKQRWFASEVHSRRHGRPRSLPRESRTVARLRALWPRLVCVQGEANAWPRLHPARQPAELVHWVGHRPATGATYEAVIAPRRVLGPVTASQIGLSADHLQAGLSVERWHESFAAFLRPDDVLVHWGRFYRDLAVSDGLPLPAESVDLRALASQLHGGRAGTLESYVSAFAVAATALPEAPAGRGGARLASVVAILRALLETGAAQSRARATARQAAL